ncbi:MAG TPA: hypothetical protein PKM25_16670, partial [Candidatus Ozemobacteraceae bacterium]|nr:hypothetical protein [Candidatus Ozemobacteraceae bacterium]
MAPIPRIYGNSRKIAILCLAAWVSIVLPACPEPSQPATFTDALQRIDQFLTDTPKSGTASGAGTGTSTDTISIIEDDLPPGRIASGVSSVASLSSDTVVEPLQTGSSSLSAGEGQPAPPAGTEGELDGLAEPASAAWIPIPQLPERSRPEESGGRLVKPQGEGILDVVVTTVREKTPRQISILPERVELWAQDRLLASLENGEAGVENAFHRRIFNFPSITLPAGYYFLTIRGFAEGFVTREHKWKG